MPSSRPVSTLTLVVDGGPDISPDELDAVTRQLRSELEELDVDSVSIKQGDATPEGTKAGDATVLGALVMNLVPAVVPRLIEFLQAWSLRGQGRTVTIKVAAKNRSAELQFPVGTDHQELERLVEKISASMRAQ
jgi:hypothetical protein